MRRVVITGIGLVTPLAANKPKTWERLINGESGITSINTFDTTDYTAKIAGLVPTEGEHGFRVDEYVSVKEQKYMDRFIILGLKAADEAIIDAGVDNLSEEGKLRTGVLIGSGIGGLQAIQNSAITLHEKGPKRISPFFIPSSLINLLSGNLAIRYGFRGPNHAVVTACCTGAHAIGDASRMISYGDADIMIAGGSEAAVCPLGLAGFAAARALSTAYNDNPTAASRPWDQDRDGFVMGEGAGVFVLEEYEHAKKRGAKIYAEVLGYGMSGDAYHITAPHPEGDGGYRAMQNALNNAKLSPTDIDYINAHATSTPLGDELEIRAIKKLFNSCLDNLSISSTKSATGHLLGAAGSLEAGICALAMQDNILPATLNLDNPSESCQGLDLVPNEARSKKIKTVLSNSFGFGGTNVCLILGKI